MRSDRYFPFIKSSSRGSSYHVRGGRYWIIKTSGKWHLVQMGRPSEGQPHVTLGRYATLQEAVGGYCSMAGDQS